MGPLRPNSGQAGCGPSVTGTLNSPTTDCAVGCVATGIERIEDRAIPNAFKKSHKLARSPPAIPFGNSRKTLLSPVETPRSTGETGKEVEQGKTTGGSPRQEFILKMRFSEEEAIGRCRKTLQRIRLAMNRQRNINMEVQTGIGELEELIDVIEDSRESWKKAEREREDSMHMLECVREPSVMEEVSTHSTGQNKRCAASPAEINPGKKVKNKISDSGQQNLRDDGENDRVAKGSEAVLKKRKRKRSQKRIPRKLKNKPEAVLVKPTSGYSYAEVLTNLKAKVRPEATNVAVRSISKTKSGAILLVIGKGGEKGKFCEAIRSSLKEAAVVEGLKPKSTVEIQDLDALCTTEEIQEAVNRTTGVPVHDIGVHMTALNHREQRRAFVSLPIDGANKVLKTERILIGITSCRVRFREEIKRCYRCFASGHMQWECKGPDRKSMGLCIRCGETGHMMKECVKSPKCCVCIQEGRRLVDHIPGSRSCEFRNQRAR